MKHIKSMALAASSAVAIMLGTGIASANNVVTVNTVQIFGTIDPAKINDYTEYMAGVNLYEALTTLDGSGAIQPLLSESWSTSADGLTWTARQRAGHRQTEAKC